MPPSLEDIEGIAESILDELPSSLRKRTSKLKIITEDFPDAFVEQEMELETPFDLLGCYQSAGPAVLGHMAGGAQRKDTLYLYRRPILDAWAETGEDLAKLINRVMIQEIGHHFGYTNDEIDMYEEEVFGATVSDISAG